MYPIIEIFGFAIPSWHIFFLIAAFIAWKWAQWAGLWYQVPQQSLQWFYCICYVSGYFGARLFSLIVEYESFDWPELFEAGSMTMYGGFLGAVAAGSIWVYGTQKKDKARFFDIGIGAGLLAIAVGRIGCFLNGDDYGVVSDSWLAVKFVSHGNGPARLPVQLFEFCSVTASVTLATVMLRRILLNFRYGLLGVSLSLYYSIQRFCLEYYRGDPRGDFYGGLSPAQGVSLVVGGVCVTLLIVRKWRRDSPAHSHYKETSSQSRLAQL